MNTFGYNNGNGNNGVGYPMGYNAPTDPAIAAFNACYATTVAAHPEQALSEPTSKETFDQIFAGVPKECRERVKKNVKDFRLGLSSDAKAKNGAKPEAEKGNKKSATDDTDDGSIEFAFDPEDRTIMPCHTAIAYGKSVDFERLADTVFGSTCQDYIGCRLGTINVKDQQHGNEKSIVTMELQFHLSPQNAEKGKIKNVIMVQDDVETIDANDSIDDVLNLVTTQRSITKEKADIKLNTLTRKLLSKFISKACMVIGKDGKPTPDWPKIENVTTVTLGTTPGNMCCGEQIICVKIDPNIFASCIMTIIEEANPASWMYSISYYYPITPQAAGSMNGEFSKVVRFGENVPFLFEFRQVSCKEHAALLKTIGLGRYSAYPTGPMYQAPQFR